MSTYLLGALTSLVFVATLIAALYARATFEHERHAGLSVQKCTRGIDCSDVRVVYFGKPEDGTDAAHLERFLDFVPPAYDKATWGSADIDCVSVGKAPLIGSQLRVAILRSATDDHKSESYPIKVGSIRSGGERHLRLYFSEDYIDYKIFIRDAAHKVGENFRFYRVDDVLEISDFKEPAAALEIAAAPVEVIHNEPPAKGPDRGSDIIEGVEANDDV